MGSAEPRSFSRGKRGIAGTLVFTIFDRDALIMGLKEASEQYFHRVLGDLNMEVKKDGRPLTIDEWDRQATEIGTAGLTADAVSNQTEALTNTLASQKANIYYADEIPPFDITVSFVNEYGQKAVLVIYGVEILNEGSAFGIDQVTSEKACTFVARKIDYMRAVGSTTQTAESKETSKATSN